jgi:hypothetical protein
MGDGGIFARARLNINPKMRPREILLPILKPFELQNSYGWYQLRCELLIRWGS